MKYLILPVIAATVTLTACSTAPVKPVQPVQAIAQFHDTVVNQCKVFMPVLENMNAMSSQLTPQAAGFLDKATQYVNPVCGVLEKDPTATITLQQVQDMIDNGVPALLKVVGNSSLSEDKKTAVDFAIVGAQAAISFELNNVVSAP